MASITLLFPFTNQQSLTLQSAAQLIHDPLRLEDYDPAGPPEPRKIVIIDEELTLIDVSEVEPEEYNAIRDQLLRDGQGFLLVYSTKDRAILLRHQILVQQDPRGERQGLDPRWFSLAAHVAATSMRGRSVWVTAWNWQAHWGFSSSRTDARIPIFAQDRSYTRAVADVDAAFYEVVRDIKRFTPPSAARLNRLPR
ncbi:hypothetical protein B0H67DRAFT_134119 [Lasiosphaeris hirsuta]|uniref:Uncharacterized protein n=1 Tax=Lasiosphaeris hirsuta TaxID=260670 RepID=A0AA40B0N9_9PEZI|nr:hypothetical protein B0H67DRAFT_134119 [Lasiosphaeris hirsuta]